MKFKDYSDMYFKTTFIDHSKPLNYNDLLYNGVALSEEVGEFNGKIKKIYRDKNCIISDKDRELMLKELGDILWYIESTARLLNSSLSEVALINIKKLMDRLDNNTLKGSGDER